MSGDSWWFNRPVGGVIFKYRVSEECNPTEDGHCIAEPDAVFEYDYLCDDSD
jgi:hypothetical protein